MILLECCYVAYSQVGGENDPHGVIFAPPEYLPLWTS
jgi:hypothetical protein